MHQIFSAESATRALVFVRAILEDLRNEWFSFLELQNSGDLGEMQKKQKKIEHHLEELAQVGCLCKDIEAGVVDFPAFKNGQLIYLCWKLGEESVDKWHGADENFTDRKHLNTVANETLHM